MRRELEPEELIACWTLVEGDMALVGNKPWATLAWVRPVSEVAVSSAGQGGTRRASSYDCRPAPSSITVPRFGRRAGSGW